jgi:hypothetical protein
MKRKMNKIPRRIQRKRTRGWKMPKGAIYVGRPTRWGNPFTCGGDNARAVKLYEKYILDPDAHDPDWNLDELLESLRGHDLVCWCSLDKPCHADILLRLANNMEIVSGICPVCAVEKDFVVWRDETGDPALFCTRCHCAQLSKDIKTTPAVDPAPNTQLPMFR